MGSIKKTGLSLAVFSLVVTGLSGPAQAGPYPDESGKPRKNHTKDRKPHKKNAKQEKDGKTRLEKKKPEWASASR